MKFFEARNSFSEQLDDDRGSNEGGKSDKDNRETGKASTRDEIDVPVNEMLIVELYSK